MMSTCKLGTFWPDGGQKMAWLQVNSGTLSLSLIHIYPFFFENEDFFLCFQSNQCPQAAFFFQLKVAPSLMGTMHLFLLVSKTVT